MERAVKPLHFRGFLNDTKTSISLLLLFFILFAQNPFSEEVLKFRIDSDYIRVSPYVRPGIINSPKHIWFSFFNMKSCQLEDDNMCCISMTTTTRRMHVQSIIKRCKN